MQTNLFATHPIGTRSWFNATLDRIQGWGGWEVRQQAVDGWLNIIVNDPLDSTGQAARDLIKFEKDFEFKKPQSPIERAENLPFIVRDFVKNKIENMDEELADALLDRYLITEHNNCGQPFYSSDKPARTANSWICDASRTELQDVAARELKRMTGLAIATDNINISKENRNWLHIFDLAIKNGDILSLDLNSIDWNPLPSKILDLPTELKIKKNLQRIKMRTNDEFAHIAKLIGSGRKHTQTGSWNVKERADQRKRWAEFAQNTTVYSPSTGESLRMSEIIEATRKKRFAEVYSMSIGIQKCAERLGLDWCFAVLTAPPRFHPNPTAGKVTWDGSLANDAHKFILQKWRQATDELRLTHNIQLAGFRSPEPHEDGCAHQNVVFYCHPEQLATVQRVIRAHFDWHEAAVKFMQNGHQGKNLKAASFASYCMKYAMKSLSLESDSSTDTWYSVWGIRRYQFFGVPRLSVWRTLRSLAESPSDEPLVNSVWRAARRGDGATFIELNGGLCITQNERPIKCKTESDGSIKKTSIEFRKKEIFSSQRESWRLMTKYPTHLKPNKDVGFGVIYKLSKGSQIPNQNHIFADFYDDPRLRKTLH